jgi:limonene-1,2-epoxide hydrolase
VTGPARARSGVSLPAVSGAANVGVVRMLWAAVREQDVEAVVSLADGDVVWEPTAVHGGRLHGRSELRGYLSRLRTARTLADAHPYSFEAVGESVIVSGVLRLRREDDVVEDLHRWWVYAVGAGKVVSASSHTSRADAMRAVRAGHGAR